MSELGSLMRDSLYIGGEWTKPTDGRLTDVIDPYSEQVIGRAALAGPGDVDGAARAAREAFDAGPWPCLSHVERATVMRRAGELIVERGEELSRLTTLEVGSPVAVAQPQPHICKALLDWYADQAETFPWEELRRGAASEALVRRPPVGVVGAIVPWNFPLLLSISKVAPALLTGCTVILKPPEETPLHSFPLAEIFQEAGLPPGVLNVVPADRATSEKLVEHPLVDKISFTGSTRAGQRIASICGSQLKRCTLELGGKGAAILLPDADLDHAIPALAPWTMYNNGETCVNQTRVLAPRERYDDVVDALRVAIGGFRVGDPSDPAVDIGPLVSSAHRERVEGYIASGKQEGAQVVLGGGRPEYTRGYFVEPTIFANVDNRMAIARDEIFGPVVAVISYDREEQAVEIANDSPYGLACSVWGADAERALEVARSVRSGSVSVNQHTPENGALPFGGFKQSGLGREGGLEGIDGYVEIQTIPFAHLTADPPQ